MSIVIFGLLGICCLLAYPYISKARRIRRLSTEKGCRPPPSLPQKDPIFGLDLVLQDVKIHREHRRASALKQRFETYGYTYDCKFFGTRMIWTADPMNIQSVYSTDFTSFGVEPFRFFAFEPFLGKGVMDTDGHTWERSRALMKPMFMRS